MVVKQEVQVTTRQEEVLLYCQPALRQPEKGEMATSDPVKTRGPQIDLRTRGPHGTMNAGLVWTTSAGHVWMMTAGPIWTWTAGHLHPDGGWMTTGTGGMRNVMTGGDDPTVAALPDHPRADPCADPLPPCAGLWAGV